MFDRRRRDPQVHLRRARLAKQRHDARRGCAAHDRIVDDDDTLSGEILDDGIELQMYAARPHRLIGADERTADVAILDEPFDVWEPALGGVADAAGYGRVGNG